MVSVHFFMLIMLAYCSVASYQESTFFVEIKDIEWGVLVIFDVKIDLIPHLKEFKGTELVLT